MSLAPFTPSPCHTCEWLSLFDSTYSTLFFPAFLLSVFLFPFFHLSDEQQPELNKKIMENLCDSANNGCEGTYDVLYHLPTVSLSLHIRLDYTINADNCLFLSLFSSLCLHQVSGLQPFTRSIIGFVRLHLVASVGSMISRIPILQTLQCCCSTEAETCFVRSSSL